jgi:hypothetical protein
MKKANKKSINFGFKILTILAFVLFFAPFNKTMAQTVLYGYGTSGNAPSSNSNYSYSPYTNSYYNNTPYQPPIYTPTPAATTTPVVYSSGANPNANNGASVMTVTYTPTPAVKTNTTASKTAASATTTNSNSANNLAANAVYGGNSFLPSGLIQWILFAIFILLLVILVRKIFGAEERYHASPLKHE